MNKPIEIDHSESLSDVAHINPNEENWEPPPHVFYGKRLANGKSEKLPPYTYQEYPRMLWKLEDNRLRTRVVGNDADKMALLNSGWGLSPADFGVETCPSRAWRAKETYVPVVTAEAPVEAEVETIDAPKPKNKGGRPRKNPLKV